MGRRSAVRACPRLRVRGHRVRGARAPAPETRPRAASARARGGLASSRPPRGDIPRCTGSCCSATGPGSIRARPSSARAAASPATRSPTVWVLADHKPGHTTQSIGLAEELGWPYEKIDLELSRIADLPNELLGRSPLGLRNGARKALTRAKPDLVIGAGRRTAPVGRWLRRESRGATRSVQLGRIGVSPAARIRSHRRARLRPAAERPAADRGRDGADARASAGARGAARALARALRGASRSALRGARRRARTALQADARARRAHGARHHGDGRASRRLRVRHDEPTHARGRGRRARGDDGGCRPLPPLEPGRRPGREPLSRLPGARGRVHRHGRERLDARRSQRHAAARLRLRDPARRSGPRGPAAAARRPARARVDRPRRGQPREQAWLRGARSAASSGRSPGGWRSACCAPAATTPCCTRRSTSVGSRAASTASASRSCRHGLDDVQRVAARVRELLGVPEEPS